MLASINISLDLTKAYTAPVELVQGEKNARRLLFTVSNGGVLINMTGKAVCLQITKPDGTSCLIQATVTAVGKCYVDLKAQAVAASGNAKCQLIVMTAEAMGTATSGTATSMYDTSKTWTADEHIGKSLYIYSGTGAGQIRNISDNTATQLIVDAVWTVNPAAGAGYAIISESGLSFPFPAHITASDDVATAAESTDEFSALTAALALTEGMDARIDALEGLHEDVYSATVAINGSASAGNIQLKRVGNVVLAVGYAVVTGGLSTTTKTSYWDALPVGYRPVMLIQNMSCVARSSTDYTSYVLGLCDIALDGVVSCVSTVAAKTTVIIVAKWLTTDALPT